MSRVFGAGDWLSQRPHGMCVPVGGVLDDCGERGAPGGILCVGCGPTARAAGRLRGRCLRPAGSTARAGWLRCSAGSGLRAGIGGRYPPVGRRTPEALPAATAAPTHASRSWGHPVTNFTRGKCRAEPSQMLRLPGTPSPLLLWFCLLRDLP